MDYKPLKIDEYVFKYKSDPGIDESMPSHLGVFILSHCKKVMNNFVH